MYNVDIEELNDAEFWHKATVTSNREVQKEDVTEKLDYLCDFGIITTRKERAKVREMFKKCTSLNELDRTYHAILVRESIA